MGLAARNTGKPKDVPAEGSMLARLVGLIDLGHQPGYIWKGEAMDSKYKVVFTYELVGSFMEDGRPHWVSEDVNVSDFVGDGLTSKMMKRVMALDPSGVLSDNGKNLKELIGLPCMVTITYNDKGYPKIDAVVSAPVGFPVAELVNDTIIFNMDNPNMDIYNKLPEFTQKKIKSALDLEDTPLYAKLNEQQVGADDVPF